jgi:acyl carrier protein
MTTFEKIRNIIAEQLGIDDVESIKKDTSIMGDLDADSLDTVEIMMSIEDKFEIEIPEEDAEKFKNIGDIVNYVEKKIA